MRTDDEEAAFAERLGLNRTNTARVIALAHDLEVNVVTLDARESPSELTAYSPAYVRKIARQYEIPAAPVGRKRRTTR